MKSPSACLVIPFLVLLLSGGVTAEEKAYILASGKPPRPVGLTYKRIKNSSMKDVAISVKAMEKEKNGTMNTSRNQEELHEWFSQDKFRVSFRKNRSFKKVTMAGPPEEEETIGEEEGKTVIFEKKEGVWTAKLEKGEVKPADQAVFDEEVGDRVAGLNESKSLEGALAMFGTRPRKIGEQWKVDPKNLPWTDDIKIAGGEMTMKFLKVRQYNGEDCAVLKAEFNLSGEMVDDSMEGFPVKLEGSVRVIRSMKYFMEYKSKGSMTMVLEGEMAPQPGMVASLLMKGEIELDSKTVFIEQKKK